MSWQGSLSTMVRHLISDVDPANYKYSPKRIETTVLIASQFVTIEADFPNTYSIDIERCTLDPDPTDTGTRDDDFLSLVGLKTACIILGSEIKAESGNAISIKDGPSQIDLRGVSGTLSMLYKDLSEKYNQMLLDYKAGNSVSGHAILSPFSPGSDNVRRTYSDHDLRGGYFRY